MTIVPSYAVIGVKFCEKSNGENLVSKTDETEGS